MDRIRLARLVASAELPIVVALAPALLFPTPARLLILCVILVVWASARIAGGRFLPATPMNAAILLLLVMVGMSLYATFDVEFSLGKVSGVVLGTLIFWAVTRWTTTSYRLIPMTAAFVLAGTGLALLGLLGTHHPEFEHPDAWAARWPLVIRGVPGAEDGFNPNAVAGCLILFVPIQIALLGAGGHCWLSPYVRTHSAARIVVAVQVALLTLTAGTVLLMRSRGAFAGLVFAGVCALIVLSRRARVTLGIGFAAIVVITIAMGPRNILQLAAANAGLNLKQTVSIRLDLWTRAIAGIREFPLTGMGMNVARTVLPVRPPHRDMAHAHNHLLQAALDLGIPGLIAYLAIWILVSAQLLLVYLDSRDRVYRAMAAGLQAGLIAHFVFGMTDAIPLGAKVGVLFWLTLALAGALHRVATDAPATPTTPLMYPSLRGTILPGRDHRRSNRTRL